MIFSPIQLFLLVAMLFAMALGGGDKHERYIIKVPIKYHTIHHVKVQKVPIYLKKHVHHHKYEEHDDDGDDYGHGYDRHDAGGYGGYNSAYGSYEDQSEDYY